MKTNKTSPPLRIFLVEDNEHDRLVFHRALQKSKVPFEITECIRAEEALERLRSEASLFDVAVVDHHLPGMTGVELCKELVHEEIPLPTVFLTGSGSEQIAVDALKTGAYDYIIKDPGQGYLDLLPVVLPAVAQKHGERLARKKAEEALQKAYYELEIRVEQRTAELRESQEKYRDLVESVNEVIWEIDTEGTITYISPRARDILGYEPEEMVGKAFFEFVPSDEAKETKDRFIANKDKSTPIDIIETKSIQKDGSIAFHESSGKPFFDPHGKLLGYRGVSRDVTARKRAEEALRESEKRLALIVEATKDGIWDWDPVNNKAYASKRLKELVGLTRGFVQRKIDAWFSCIHPYHQDMVRHTMNRHLEGKGDYNVDYLYRSNYEEQYHWYNVQGMALFDENGKAYRMVGSIRDIDERKRAEEALRESELKYRLLIDNYNAPVTVLDRDGVTLVMNHAAARGLGGRPEDFVGKKFDEYFPNAADFRERHRNIIETDKGVEFEEEIETVLGKRWYWSNIQPIKDVNDKVYGLQIISYDISKRKQAEEALRSERNKFKSVINAIGEDVFIVNRDYTIEYLSESYGDTSGNGKGEKCHNALFHLNEPCKFCAMKKTLETGEVQDIEVIFPDGRHGNLIYSPFIDVDNNDKVIVLSRDITEKKTMEAEAMRAGHLASLGELAAGVAHEINNPVTGIIACSEILKSRCQAQGGNDEIPTRIIKEGVRIAKIVKNLLSFAQDRKEEHNLAQVKEIVLDALNLVERQITKDGTKISLDFPPDLPMIKVRTHRVQQVFLNILSNSRYALNKRYPGAHKDKLLEIRGETIEIEGHKHVRTTFFDKGTGMPPDILDKIIGPFFSTKPQGEGTGLGLSISHGIIKAHGGRLWFESAEGEYTKAMVDIPADNGR